jgi:hypothetical protein
LELELELELLLELELELLLEFEFELLLWFELELLLWFELALLLWFELELLLWFELELLVWFELALLLWFELELLWLEPALARADDARFRRLIVRRFCTARARHHSIGFPSIVCSTGTEVRAALREMGAVAA